MNIKNIPVHIQLNSPIKNIPVHIQLNSPITAPKRLTDVVYKRCKANRYVRSFESLKAQS
jgi:hypothetical protein